MSVLAFSREPSTGDVELRGLPYTIGMQRMGKLELQVQGEAVVFAHYLPSDAGPNNGGYISRVYPGGTFKGLGFGVLWALGTGSHKLALDERVQSIPGREPEYDSEWRRRFERFEFGLFMYRVGACTASQVLIDAEEVIKARNGPVLEI